MALMLTGCSARSKNLKPDEAKARAENFINAALMSPGSQAIVKEIEQVDGFYKIQVDIGGGEPIESYLSLDGKLFFPQALDIDLINEQLASNSSDSSGGSVATVEQKSDKPTVDLFVMSYCPYGLQMERGILPVVEKLGDKIDFKIRFCDYAMHDKPEIEENLAQYCIQKEQPNKFLSYLNCFIKSGNAVSCYKEAKIDESALNTCTSTTDKQYNIMASFNDQNSWNSQFPPFNIDKADNEKYNVQGSPTLIINGQEVSSNRDSASLLKTICSAFNNAPEECSAELSSNAPAAGFTADTSGGAASSEASCQ
jgi:thiol-disulfide isomerase/thioredoxin